MRAILLLLVVSLHWTASLDVVELSQKIGERHGHHQRNHHHRHRHHHLHADPDVNRFSDDAEADTTHSHESSSNSNVELLSSDNLDATVNIINGINNGVIYIPLRTAAQTNVRLELQAQRGNLRPEGLLPANDNVKVKQGFSLSANTWTRADPLPILEFPLIGNKWCTMHINLAAQLAPGATQTYTFRFTFVTTFEVPPPDLVFSIVLASVSMTVMFDDAPVPLPLMGASGAGLAWGQALPGSIVNVHPKTGAAGLPGALIDTDLDVMTRVVFQLHTDGGQRAHVRVGWANAASRDMVKCYTAGVGGPHPAPVEVVAAGNGLYDVSNMGAQFTLYFTAIAFKSSAWDGTAELRLWFDDGATVLRSAVLNVSPWMMAGHHFPITDFFYYDSPLFVDGQLALRVALENQADASFGNPAHRMVVRIGGEVSPFIQDHFEAGFVQGNAANTQWGAVQYLRPNEVLTANIQAQITASGQTLQVTPNFAGNQDLEAGGNMEVTPQLTPNYPLGRIYMGCLDMTSGRFPAIIARYPEAVRPVADQIRDCHPTTMQFLELQMVQKPIYLFSQWLAVGHVDEMVTFVPLNADPTPQQIKVLYVSPRAMQTLLTRIRDGLEGVGQDGNTATTIRGNPTINDLITFDSAVMTSQPDYNGWDFNLMIDDFMVENVRLLQVATGIPAQNFIPIPMLFEPQGLSVLASSMVPNSINAVVSPTGLLIADAHFLTHPGANVDYITRAITAAVNPLPVRTVDDSVYAAFAHGDVHCFTNVQRDVHQAPKWYLTRPQA